MDNYIDLKPFRFWCQKVLPLAYDDSLSYYELLCKVVDYLNKTMQNVETLHSDVTNLHTAYEKLQSYVNDYFSSLDVQEEINNKLDDMANSGELYEIIRRYTDPITNKQNEKINEQNEKIDVLKSRMDTFASLPSGSTAGNAELTDIRVGYNSVIYPSAGDAVRGQVSELNDYLTLCYKNEKEIIKNNDIDIIVDKHVGEFWNTSNTNQKDNNIPNAIYTNIFEVNEGDEIIVTSNSYLTAVAYILYDSDKNVVSYKNNNMRVNKTYNVVIPSNVKYMRASSLDKDTFVLKMKNTILNDVNKKISIIENDILSIPSSKFAVGNEKEISSTLYITGKFINKSASEADNENAKCTDYLSLVEYPVMYVSAKSMYATCIYALYDKDKNPVMKDVTANIYATFGYDTEYTNKLICTSDILKEYPTARYIRFCSYPTTQKDLKVIYRPLMNIFDVIDGNTLSNKSVYVFGDSIMHGHVDGYGIAELLNDEKHMVSTNYAQNGKMISSGDIYTQINNASDTIPDFVVFDGYINDVFQDITNFGKISDGYDTFPDTFCGQFEKVCNIIRTKYPTSKVFYFTVHKINFHMPQQKQLHNLCVEMCKKWNISVIDMFNHGQMNTYFEYQKTNYTKNGDGTHPTTEAYKKYYLPMLLDKMILN